MWKIILLLQVMPLTLFRTTCKVEGLEITMEADTKILPGGQTTCGVLHCVEEGEEPRVNHIAELSVFKMRAAEAAPPSRTRVASVSEQQPGVSRFWDGMKVDGAWTKQKAQIILYLAERDDCSAVNFVCEVRIVNGKGEERVGVAQLGKAGSEPGTTQTATSPGGSHFQPNAIIQQTFSALESTVQQLHNRLGDRLQHLENRFEDKLNVLERSLIKLESKLTAESDFKKFMDYYSSFPKTPENISGAGHFTSNLNRNLNSLDKKVDTILQNSVLTLSLIDLHYKNEYLNTTLHLRQCSRELLSEILEAVKRVEGFMIGTSGSKLIQTSSCTRREAAYQMVVPVGNEPPYLCDAQTDGGGWIIIQRRSNGNVDFYRNWASYKEGFGSLADEFWLGNERIHRITSESPYELMVSLAYNNKTAFAHYQSFSVDSEANNYTLRLGAYDGTAGDALNYHRDMAFSTFDEDHDFHSLNCATLFRGAWWYSKCHSSNLNGEWGAGKNKGPRWSHFTGENPVTSSQMKIRRL